MRASAAALLLAALAALAQPAAAIARVSPPTRSQAWIARLVARTPAWDGPRAAGTPHMLAPLGRWTDGPIGLLVLEARGKWVRVLLPTRPNGSSKWVNAERVRLVRTRWRVEVDRSARRLTLLRDGHARRTFDVVVGAPGTPTPTGRFAIYETARQPDPHGFLGPFALHLTGHSDVLDDFGGGPGRLAIHGRGGSSLADPLGSARSHGCIRIGNAAVRLLARVLAPGVPVVVSS